MEGSTAQRLLKGRRPRLSPLYPTKSLLGRKAFEAPKAAWTLGAALLDPSHVQGHTLTTHPKYQDGYDIPLIFASQNRRPTGTGD
jgi:hypothetical protein